MNFLQPIDNHDLLGAFIFALPAFDAFVRPFYLGLSAIAKARNLRRIIYDGVIVLSKGIRDVDAVRTRHSVAAPGTGNRA